MENQNPVNMKKNVFNKYFIKILIFFLNFQIWKKSFNQNPVNNGELNRFCSF
jgi:hypothetical protein